MVGVTIGSSLSVKRPEINSCRMCPTFLTTEENYTPCVFLRFNFLDASVYLD